MAISDKWKNWVSENILRGVKKHELIGILLQNNFCHSEIYNGIPELYTGPLSQHLYLPGAEKKTTSEAEIYILKNFFNTGECYKLINLIESNLQYKSLNATINSEEEFKTNNIFSLTYLESSFVREIETRICKLIGIPCLNYEPVRDLMGQIDLSNDSFYLNVANSMDLKIFTFMAYLDNLGNRSDKILESLNLDFNPKRGTVLIWHNYRDNYKGDGITQLNGKISTRSKYMLSKCFCLSHVEGQRSIHKEENEYLKSYSKKGFRKLKISPNLFNKLKNFLRKNNSKKIDEELKSGFLYSNNNNAKGASSLIPISSDLQLIISQEVQSLLESWLKIKVIPTYVYGVRIYNRGSVLKMHRDRIKTHVFGAIINIAQKVDKDWPLEIEDTFYRLNKVIIKPGEVLLYEGGRLLHGRPSPFEGDYFVNVFCHCVPLK